MADLVKFGDDLTSRIAEDASALGLLRVFAINIKISSGGIAAAGLSSRSSPRKSATASRWAVLKLMRSTPT